VRARFLFFGAVALASALAACGGGGGGGGGNPPPTNPPVTPTPTASATATPPINVNGCVVTGSATRGVAQTQAVGIQPGNGSGFSYTGTLSDVIDRSSPCPIGTASASATVSITASMTTATNEHSVEKDAYATNTTQVTTDATVAESKGTADTFSESAETSTDLGGDATTTTYGLGSLLYAVASPIPYPATIVNKPPSEVDVTLADSSTLKRTYASAGDGSYSEVDTLPGVNPSGQISVASSGAASYTIQTPNFASQGISSLQVSFAAPSGGTIVETRTYSGSAPPTPGPKTITQWWPAGAPLYSDTTSDVGSGAVPAPCNPSPSVSTAEHFARTITQIDPALGSYDTRTIDSYVVQNYSASGHVVGPVCVVISDVDKLFYDYYFDTPYFVYVSADGKPFQTDTVNEAYWFASAPTTYARIRSASSTAASPALAASIAAHAAGISFHRTIERAQRIDGMLRTLGALHLGGFVK
jgi:hypothetical protein